VFSRSSIDSTNSCSGDSERQRGLMGELGHVSTSDELERMVIERHAVSLNCTIGSESVCVVWSSRTELYRAISCQDKQPCSGTLNGKEIGIFRKVDAWLTASRPSMF
jgi:hypothetical protein